MAGLMTYGHWGTMGVAIIIAAVLLYKLCKAHKRVSTAPSNEQPKVAV